MKKFAVGLFLISASFISSVWLAINCLNYFQNPIRSTGYVVRCISSVLYIDNGKGITVAYSPTGKILTCEESRNG